MAPSNVLSAAGHPPESLRTNAHVQLRNINGVPTLARITLDTEGRVPGIDERQFQVHAEASGCARCLARWPGPPSSS